MFIIIHAVPNLIRRRQNCEATLFSLRPHQKPTATDLHHDIESRAPWIYSVCVLMHLERRVVDALRGKVCEIQSADVISRLPVRRLTYLQKQRLLYVADLV